jgi:hypothetical protein
MNTSANWRARLLDADGFAVHNSPHVALELDEATALFDGGDQRSSRSCRMRQTCSVMSLFRKVSFAAFFIVVITEFVDQLWLIVV